MFWNCQLGDMKGNWPVKNMLQSSQVFSWGTQSNVSLIQKRRLTKNSKELSYCKC